MKPIVVLVFTLLIATFFSAILIYSSSNIPEEVEQVNNDLILKASVKLCSGRYVDIGKCTGSVYCKACKTCNYCAYCNNGGSCGVCGKRPSKPKVYTYPSPSQKPKTYTYPSRKKKAYDNKESTILQSSIKTYYLLTLETSLRKLPTSKSEVLLRFKTGDTVGFIEHYNEWWSKVKFEGRIGYVKRRLLK